MRVRISSHQQRARSPETVVTTSRFLGGNSRSSARGQTCKPQIRLASIFWSPARCAGGQLNGP
jgi:hypothetical protein